MHSQSKSSQVDKLLLHCYDQIPNRKHLGVQFIKKEKHGDRSSSQLCQPELATACSPPNGQEAEKEQG